MNSWKLVFAMLCIVSFPVNGNSQLWKQYMDSAINFRNQKNTNKAIVYFTKSKEELQIDSMWTNTHARVSNSIAILYIGAGQFKKAEPIFLEVRQIRERVSGKEHPDYAQSCNNLGNLYSELGQDKKAELFYLEAAQVWDKALPREQSGYAITCNGLAGLYRNRDQYDKAESFYLEARRVIEKLNGKDHPDYGSSCNNLANLYRDMGQYLKAEPLYLEDRLICEKVNGKDDPCYVTSCINLAGLYSDMGLCSTAGPLFLEARLLAAKVLGKDHISYATSTHNLADYYLEDCQYEKAEPLFLESRQIRKMVLGNESPEYAESCNDLALFYKDLGQYEKAEGLLLEAKKIREKALGRDHTGYAQACTNLAVLYLAMSEYKKAELFYLEGRQILAKALGMDHRDYAKSCDNLGVLYSFMSQFEKAEQLLLEGKESRRKVLGTEHPEYASSCINLAALYMESGQYEKAEPLFTESKEIREKIFGKTHPDYAASCDALADLFRNMGQDEKANTYYAEVLRLQSEQIEKIFQFTSETEKQSYIKEIANLGDNFLSFNTTNNSNTSQGAAYDLSLSNRNLILNSSQQLRNAMNNNNDTIVHNKYNKWMRARQQIAFWYTKSIGDRPAYVNDLEEQANTLEKDLTLLSSAFRKDQGKNEIVFQTIQNDLKPNEAAIEFVEFQYHNGRRETDSIYYIALILRKDKPDPLLVSLFEKKQLDSLFSRKSQLEHGGKNFIGSLYQPGAKNEGNSKSAYSLIWQPLEKNLKGIRRVYFAPEGLLHRISFAAIPINDQEVLSDRYQLIQLNTTASVVGLPVTVLSASDNVILYGGVKYDADSTSLSRSSLQYASNRITSGSLPIEMDRGDRGNTWEYLPASHDEIKGIEKLGRQKKMPVTLLSDINATEESIKSIDAKNSPALLHIATHGFFFPDPKEDKRNHNFGFETSGKAFRQSDNPLFRSGLLFAGANNAWKGKPVKGIEDGILTAYEVSNLYLPNTKLVVLSACETGLGDIQGSEGVYGLQRSFKMAGVQNLVMSLWKVPDEATSEFMRLFYQNMFNKQSIADAFYKAQAAMKNKYRNNPYNWAAWVLVR